MGRHSYNDILISSQPAGCHRESTDILVAFEPETLCRHALTVAESGFIIYSADDADVEFNQLPYLDDRFRDDINATLSANALPSSTRGLVQMVHQRGVSGIGVPYRSLLARLADELGLPRQAVSAVLNTLAVSISATLMYLPQERLLSAVEAAFAGRDDIIRMNRQAVTIAYEYARQYALEQIGRQRYRIPSAGRDAERLLLTATQSVALGKLAAGMGFQSYYPISPATDESTYLEAHANVALSNGEAAGPLILQGFPKV